MRNKTKIVLLLFLGFCLRTTFCQERVQINDSVKSSIEEIINKPQKVYNLDFSGNTDNFYKIDKWFEKYINFSKAEQKSYKSGKNLSYRIAYKKNTPIFVLNEDKQGLQAKEPFNVFYEKELQKRAFYKELIVSAKQELKEDDVIKISKALILENKFCRITEIDKLSKPDVFALKQQGHENDSVKVEEYTIIQHAEFKRKFLDYEVINSKQIVGLHPQSSEILSYQNINWTPVDEKSGKSYQYLTLNEVITRIDSAYSYPDVRYVITDVKAGMYQTTKYIFPVLVVHTKRLADEKVKHMPKQTLIIQLVKDLKIEKEEVDKPKMKPQKVEGPY